MQPSIQVEYDSDRISAPIEIPEDSPSPEAIRRAHIGTEASIKAIGQLVLLGLVLEGFNLIRALGAADTSPAGTPSLLLSVAWLVAAGLCGAWLCALEPRGRLLYTLLSIVQLAMVPFELPAANALLDGTRAMMTTWATAGLALLRVAILSMLWSRKARMVMSQHYRDAIMPATPGIQYRSRVPLLAAVACVLALGLIIALVIANA